MNALNEMKVSNARRASNFYAIATLGMDMTAMLTGKSGRLLVLFVGLILSSYDRHICKSTDLHKQFSSTLGVLDEMRSIRCVEHT